MPSNPAPARIYLDACCFIDLAKHELGKCPHERLNELFFLQQFMKAADDEAVHLFTSTLSLAECRHAGKDCPVDVRHLFDSILLSGRLVTLIECSPFIAVRARDLVVENGLTNIKGADSIHIASALEVDCKEFLTTDNKGPLKNHKLLSKLGISVVRAEKTRYLPGKYRQTEHPKLVTARGSHPSGAPN